MTDKITNWTKSDDAKVEDAIRCGASRRDLLKLMLASGVALSAGGVVFGRATSAVAATPVSGGHFKATRHRVFKPPVDQLNQDRLSLVLFNSSLGSLRMTPAYSMSNF